MPGGYLLIWSRVDRVDADRICIYLVLPDISYLHIYLYYYLNDVHLTHPIDSDRKIIKNNIYIYLYVLHTYTGRKNELITQLDFNRVDKRTVHPSPPKSTLLKSS
jgi:hypothetical protein